MDNKQSCKTQDFSFQKRQKMTMVLTKGMDNTTIIIILPVLPTADPVEVTCCVGLLLFVKLLQVFVGT
jgi:hypothetical protein